MTAPSASARDLLLDGDGQRRIERPGHRAAVAARAHRPRGGGAQPVDAGLERHDGQRSGGRVHHRHRIGVLDGALRGAQRRARAPARGDQIGPDRVRVGRRHFDIPTTKSSP